MEQTTLERQAEAIERWKARRGVSGRDYVPMNSGTSRTESKRVLLRALAEDAQARNEPSRFVAKR